MPSDESLKVVVVGVVGLVYVWAVLQLRWVPLGGGYAVPAYLVVAFTAPALVGVLAGRRGLSARVAVVLGDGVVLAMFAYLSGGEGPVLRTLYYLVLYLMLASVLARAGHGVASAGAGSEG